MRFSAIQIAAYAIVGLAFSPVALAAPVGDGDFHAREARLLVPPTQPIHDIPTDQPVSQRDIANAGDEIFERRTPDMNMHSHFGRHSSEHDGGSTGPPPGSGGIVRPNEDFYRRALNSLD